MDEQLGRRHLESSPPPAAGRRPPGRNGAYSPSGSNGAEAIERRRAEADFDDDVPEVPDDAGGEGIVGDPTDIADGALALDSLLEAQPALEEGGTTIDVLNRRLAAAFSSAPALPDEDEAEPDLSAEAEPEPLDLPELATVNYDVGGVSLDDPVRMYLREIGRVPLLTGGKEVELAMAMERGDYLCFRRDQLRRQLGHEPSAVELGQAIYTTFRTKWPEVVTLYRAMRPGEPLPTKPMMLPAPA